MTSKTLYCNMLVMDETLSRALVLTKLRGPSFLINKDNFPGGHIEEGETPEEGAIRETAEEANVQITDSPVVLLKHLVTEKSELYTYAASVPNKDFEAIQSMTEEPLRIVNVESYLALLALEPERAAPDITELITKGIDLLGVELAKRNQATPAP